MAQSIKPMNGKCPIRQTWGCSALTHIFTNRSQTAIICVGTHDSRAISKEVQMAINKLVFKWGHLSMINYSRFQCHRLDSLHSTFCVQCRDQSIEDEVHFHDFISSVEQLPASVHFPQLNRLQIQKSATHNGWGSLTLSFFHLYIFDERFNKFCI